MAAQGPVVDIIAADGADAPADGTADAHLLLDAPFDLPDEGLIFRRAEHVGVPLQVAPRLPGLGDHPGFLHHLGAVEAGSLVFGAPGVVKDAGLAHEEPGQLFQGGPVEILLVPVGLVVAQADGEGVDLLGRQLPAGQTVDVAQFPLQGFGRLGLGLLCHSSHLVSSFFFSNAAAC